MYKSYDFAGNRHYVGDKEVGDSLDCEKLNRIIGEIQLGFLPSDMKFNRDEWLTVLTGSAPFRGVFALKMALKEAPEGFEAIKNYELPEHLEGAAQFYTAQLGDVRIPINVIDWEAGDVPRINKQKIGEYYPQLFSMRMEDGLLPAEKVTEAMTKAADANKLLAGKKPTYKDVPRVFPGFPGYRFFFNEGEALPFRIKFVKAAYYGDLLKERLHFR